MFYSAFPIIQPALNLSALDCLPWFCWFCCCFWIFVFIVVVVLFCFALLCFVVVVVVVVVYQLSLTLFSICLMNIPQEWHSTILT